MKPQRKNHASPPPARLGVDIGRVIIEGDGPDTSFIGGTDEMAMRAPPMDEAFETLHVLCQRFEGRVWLVSKCGPRIEDRTRRWLARHRFFESTGVRPDRVRFCRERKDKAPICQDLGIDFFVDDRTDVLAAMAGVVRHRFLFGAESSRDPGMRPVPTWRQAMTAILAVVDEEAATGARELEVGTEGEGFDPRRRFVAR